MMTYHRPLAACRLSITTCKQHTVPNRDYRRFVCVCAVCNGRMKVKQSESTGTRKGNQVKERAFVRSRTHCLSVRLYLKPASCVPTLSCTCIVARTVLYYHCIYTSPATATNKHVASLPSFSFHVSCTTPVISTSLCSGYLGTC